MTTAQPLPLLVVDDNEMNRDVLSRRLQRRGYRVVTAADGRHALALVDSQEFALVLLDIEMPGLSGLDVLRAVRARRSAGELPIIMVTARQESQDVVEALNAGANDYVTKPIDLPVAVARIETQVARRQAEAALQESEERYALAARGANDGLWDWNLRTSTVYYSPRWKEMLGLSDHAVPAAPDGWFGRVHAEDIDRLMADIAAHVDGLTPQMENQHRMLHADGTYRWMLSRGVAVCDAFGKACRFAGSLTDITQAKVSDPLTGLPNRILFLDRLGRSIERARRHGITFAVLFLDLDRFKLVNDSLGHQAGDRLLMAIADRLERSVRTADTVARVGSTEHTIARLGGDEFTILLEDIKHVSDAVRVADRIQDNLRTPFVVDGQEFFISASIGISTSDGGYAEPQDLLRDADTAMYRAKALGKARCEVFDAVMREEAVERLSLETDLRRAVERNEFELAYQPLVSIADDSLVGFEALIRWRHPVRGLVSPAVFIPIAEETEQIIPIGSWVLTEACRQLRDWRDAVPAASALTMHVNLSGKQFLQPDLASEVAGILEDAGVPPPALNLEITESAIVANPETAAAILSHLKGLGVKIAVDDFGTGYSSLSYLHQFPLDTLKIDRSFVRDMTPEHAGIVRTIVGLARALRLEVVAEGVETAGQLAQLAELGCDLVQGHFFAPALDTGSAADLLASGTRRSGRVVVPAGYRAAAVLTRP